MRDQPPMDVQKNVSLAAHCRFRVGGPADHFAAVTGLGGLRAALDFARDNGLRYIVLAGGSNLFFDDSGFRGLVIKLEDGEWHLGADQSSVAVSAGYWLGDLVRELAERDRGGLEFLANIPGSVGGAVVGNAGCYGRSVADVLTGAEVYDVAGGQLLDVEPGFFEFAYRHSKLKYDDRYIVVSAGFRLVERPRNEIRDEIAQELRQRLGKHPHEASCAGSYFKNPSRERPAWQVITDAGLANARVGDACLSPMHANFLINDGSATSAQIIELTHKIQRAVREHSGIMLTPEVRYVSPTGIVELRPE